MFKKKTNGGFQIYDFLRVQMYAIYKPNQIRISLPLIHVLIEKAVNRDIYVSTCLEFSQASESATPHGSVSSLTLLMYKYFFSILGSEERGREYLYEEVKKPYNNYLWDAVREYNLKRSEDELHYIEMTLRESRDTGKLANMEKKLKTKEPKIPPIHQHQRHIY